MKKNKIIETSFFQNFIKTIDRMYKMGWDEINAGNVSYILDQNEVDQIKHEFKSNGRISLDIKAENLIGRHVLITGTQKYFMNMKDNPEDGVGIIKILESGKEAEVVWGFITGGKPTSELSTHLYCHIERLLNNANHKVIIHTHATHINEMSILPNLDEKSFTRSLWEINSENIIVFPKGIGIIPWLVPGNSDIGTKTAKKMQEFDIVVWPLHGVVAAGDNLDHTFGVLETINKSAKTYMKVKDIPNRNVITKEQLIKLTNYFKVDYRKEFLD